MFKFCSVNFWPQFLATGSLTDLYVPLNTYVYVYYIRNIVRNYVVRHSVNPDTVQLIFDIEWWLGFMWYMYNIQIRSSEISTTVFSHRLIFLLD